MGLVRRRTRRRAMLVAGGMAYEAGPNRARAEQPYAEPAPPSYQEVPPVPPAPAPIQASPDLDQLQRLGEMHDAGVLTDAEFTAAKAKVLGL